MDDEPLNRLVLQDLIEEQYELEVVESGEACLELVKHRIPDLILLDINMPRLSGFDVCHTLKSRLETTNIPIIFLTALMETEDERKGFKLGAVDYITKPFTESVLLARIKTHLALSFTRQMVEKNNSALKQESEYFEQIISTMRKDKRFDKSHLRYLISPVEKSNGDIVLSASNDDNHQHILVGDFTGHGLNAAIAGPLVSSLFYIQMQENTTAPNILELINNELFHKLPSQCFLAATYIDWDKTAQNVTIWNFGMPSTVIYNREDLVGQSDSISVALGIVECCEHKITPVAFPFSEGNKLYSYTDGIYEVANNEGEYFGENALQPILQKLSSDQIDLSLLQERVEEFADRNPIQDDVTLIELSYD